MYVKILKRENLDKLRQHFRLENYHFLRKEKMSSYQHFSALGLGSEYVVGIISIKLNIHGDS